MGSPVLKSGETFSILEKTNHYQKVIIFAQSIFFRSSKQNYRKKGFFSMQVPYSSEYAWFSKNIRSDIKILV